LCKTRGIECQEDFFIGDGARWIHNLKDSYFPETIGVLDIWYLERGLKKALGEEKKSSVEDLNGLALKGQGREIIKALMEEGSRLREPEKIKKIVDVMEYVKNNLQWIENLPKVGGYGSGPVDKTVDITIARGVKKYGMSWYRKGATSLLRLRLLKLNGEWDTYWQGRLKEFVRYAA